MKSIGYYNGSYSELSSMYVPMCDRGYYFGDGVYDAAYCYNKKIFALDEHIDRFYISADLVGIKIDLEKDELKKRIQYLVNKVDNDKLFVYWQVTRGVEPRDHIYTGEIKSKISIIIKPSELRDMSKPIKVMLHEDKRHHFCNIKTINLLPNILAINEAERNGYEEVIFHRNRRITECAHSNVSILQDGKLITPPTDELILPGIGRAHLMNVCKELGIKTVEEEFYIEDLWDADEIILTAAGSLCIDVGELNGEAVGGKDKYNLMRIRQALIDEFCEYTGASIEVGK